ncbi:single-stranded DNA-binding protein [uncultured Selenomonas sp.]|uniref:single-stranded DNA-binding protein n=1 Tax=uncultured Selenomonas sp. TaxID=159275 RepID=UPI0025DB5D9B|nr:single-stranded DNA-binding protein [uncultured Selenomonas sp.]
MNKVQLIGRLTKDPQLHTTQNGYAVATFTLAVDRRFGKKDETQGGSTDFIPIVAWRKLAEIVGANLVKGRRVGIAGRMQVRTYAAADGTLRYMTEVVADEVEFLDKKQDAAQTFAGGLPLDAPVVADEDVPF